MTPLVKICGLTTPDAVAAAREADYLGFIFYPPSPRNLTPRQAASLAGKAGVKTVAVTVDASDEMLGEIVSVLKPAFLQLHGREVPARVQAIRTRFSLPVIKAITVASGDDIAAAHAYEPVSDMLLFDARPPKGLPGGNGVTFDWRLLADRRFTLPWFLSGGISADNAREALRISGGKAIDVSSSLESSPGVKDPALIGQLIETVKGISL